MIINLVYALNKYYIVISCIYYVLGICDADAEQMLRTDPQSPSPAVTSRPQHFIIIGCIYYMLGICDADEKQILRASSQSLSSVMTSRLQLLSSDIIIIKAHRVSSTCAKYMQY